LAQIQDETDSIDRTTLQRMNPNTRLSLNVEYGEVGVGKTSRAAGGVWNTQQKAWKLANKQVMALGLMDRVVSDSHEKKHEKNM
jgi:hypothetical protein